MAMFDRLAEWTNLPEVEQWRAAITADIPGLLDVVDSQSTILGGVTARRRQKWRAKDRICVLSRGHQRFGGSLVRGRTRSCQQTPRGRLSHPGNWRGSTCRLVPSLGHRALRLVWATGDSRSVALEQLTAVLARRAVLHNRHGRGVSGSTLTSRMLETDRQLADVRRDGRGGVEGPSLPNRSQRLQARAKRHHAKMMSTALSLRRPMRRTPDTPCTTRRFRSTDVEGRFDG